jgi:hypothetical protein
MAKLSKDKRSTKSNHVTFTTNSRTNVKAKSVSFANGKSEANRTESKQHIAFVNGNVDSSLAYSKQTVTLKSGGSGSNTIASEEVLDLPLTSLVNGDVHVVNPNLDFIPNEELVVVKHGCDEANFQLAIYIAMAHAGLVIAIAICYGFGLLLKDYWMPIQWALLVSMPLQRVQEAVVKFWMRHLQAGLIEALFAIPIAMLRALLQTTRDIKSLSEYDGLRSDVTFGKLFDWLFTLATCTLLFENLGLVYSMVIACVGYGIYRSLNHVHFIMSSVPPCRLFQAQQHRGTGARVLDFTVRATRYINNISLKSKNSPS